MNCPLGLDAASKMQFAISAGAIHQIRSALRGFKDTNHARGKVRFGARWFDMRNRHPDIVGLASKRRDTAKGGSRSTTVKAMQAFC